MAKTLELPLKLLLITFIAGLLLGLTNMFTAEPIAEQRAYQAQLSREEAFPGAEFELVPEDVWSANYVSMEGDAEIKEVYKAIRKDNDAGYVVTVLSGGYGGDVEIIVGVGLDHHITGLVVGTHNETAGLGANATNAPFRDQFRGKINPVLSKNEPGSDQAIDALTGATITSNAVVKGANTVMGLVMSMEADNE